MNKRIECVMLKMSLYVIILLFSLQFSAAITGKESEVVSPLLMDVNPSLTMENISELSTSSEPSQQGVFPVICTRLHPGSVMKRQLLTGWGPVFIIVTFQRFLSHQSYLAPSQNKYILDLSQK